MLSFIMEGYKSWSIAEAVCLSSYGHQFKTDCDTEVVLYSIYSLGC